jgi:putative transcriptional regulator
MSAALFCILLSALYSHNPQPHPVYTATKAHAAKDHAPNASSSPAKGHFLIASRSLGDPSFARTVVLLLSFDDSRGAMGIVVNRPTGVRLAAALPNVKELRHRPERVFLGGPVNAKVMLLLVRTPSQPKASQPIFGDVYASGSLSALRRALEHTGKTERWRAYVGYAGWRPEQLEEEIARGDWYVAPADAATVFDTPPAEMWPKLVDRFSGEWTRAGAPITIGGCSRLPQSGTARLQVALQMSTRSPSDFASGRELCAGLQLRNSKTPLPYSPAPMPQPPSVSVPPMR